jgi:hypothetical protein
MLEHPNVVQVAGDSITMFFRRWSPAGPSGNAVPWKLEAYSWGGLTQAPRTRVCLLPPAPTDNTPDITFTVGVAGLLLPAYKEADTQVSDRSR